MKILKYFRIFERLKQKPHKTNYSVGDIVDCEFIYDYVRSIHGERDFLNGKLSSRIRRHKKYLLEEVDISKLNISEYYLFDDLVDRYVDEYKSKGTYPPVVISPQYRLIDGNHRCNCLNKLGIKKVLAFRAID